MIHKNFKIYSENFSKKKNYIKKKKKTSKLSHGAPTLTVDAANSRRKTLEKPTEKTSEKGNDHFGTIVKSYSRDVLEHVDRTVCATTHNTQQPNSVHGVGSRRHSAMTHFWQRGR